MDLLDAEYASRKLTPDYVAIVRQEGGSIPVLPVILDYGTATHASGDVRARSQFSREMVEGFYEWSRKRLGLDLGLRYWQRRVETNQDKPHFNEASQFTLWPPTRRCCAHWKEQPER